MKPQLNDFITKPNQENVTDFKNIKKWSKDYGLPFKDLYWLNSEFNCLKNISKQTETNKNIIRKNENKQKMWPEPESLVPLREGIPAK